ncbi:MAG: transcriptional regulator [Chloroflexi bacterium]|nr:transcriptional regulator [Chloroflexota bacterium]
MPNAGVLHAQLNPPQLRRYTLAHPRLAALLREALDHRATIVQANTGYGKSTALAQMADWNLPLFWYSAGEGDTDPRQFLSHLIAALRLRLPAFPEGPLALLQDADAGAPAALDAVLHALDEICANPSLLVIDDYYLASSPETDALLEHLIASVPPALRVIVATRYPLQWKMLVGWRAGNQVLEIKRAALAFTPDEIAALFRDTYNLPLAPHDVELLAERTEGWPIALQLIRQEMRSNPQAPLDTLLARGSGSLATLFDYLAQSVLAQQLPRRREFVLQTCALRELEPAACNAITQRDDGDARLLELCDSDQFVRAVGERHYRYHHLFHDFLWEQARRQNPSAARDRHRRAAKFFRRAKRYDEAVYHLLQASEFRQAAALIQEIGETVLREGRLDTLAAWIDALPPDEVASHPFILFMLGELARLRSRFDDALAWYAQAERAARDAKDTSGITRALRGQALVYLDTLRPAEAEKSLQEALRLSDRLDDRATKARLLEMLAENKLNIGKAEEAERLRAQVRALRDEGPSEDALSVRVKIRTGRLDEARETLETWARAESGQLHPPRGHRETLLILSLLYAFQGRGDSALDTAQASITLGARFHSPFISAVGQLRLGHAYQIRGDLPQAIRCYQEAAALGDQLAVPRTRAEAHWGLTRAYGLMGDHPAACREAAAGIAVARRSGDIWVAGLVQIALGASHMLAGRDRDAIQTLQDGLAAFRASGDPFGRAATRLWLALACWRLRQRERALTHLDDALTLAEAQHYDYLWTRRTLLGLQDPRVIVPLLLEARQREGKPAGRDNAYVTRLLAAMRLEQVSAHPGDQLRIQTLGAFRVWRGAAEVSEREWQRRKARRLLQLLVTFRGKMFQREEILELLWRKETPEQAARDLRVTLNALNHALEPERVDKDPAFIAREGSACGLQSGADIWIDADEFTHLITRADAEPTPTAFDLYRRALALYQDDYLGDARYEDWTSAERERLLALYLRTADRVARELFARGEWDECLALCERILTRDRCWEHAYHLQMRVHAQRGERVQVRRVFDRCAAALRQELDLEPSPATQDLYRQLLA